MWGKGIANPITKRKGNDKGPGNLLRPGDEGHTFAPKGNTGGGKRYKKGTQKVANQKATKEANKRHDRQRR